MSRGTGLARLLPLAVVAAGVLAYVNSFSKPFLFDDSYVVVNRPDAHRVFPFRWQSRAVVDLSFKLNYAAGGVNVADYHVTNLAIHLIAGLFLFGAVRRTLGHAHAFLAFSVAAIWVVHPLQTESVTYICQRYESMMGMFYLMCVYTWIRAGESVRDEQKEPDVAPSSVVRRPLSAAAWYGLCAAAFVLGMGSKETMITVPVVLCAYDHVFNGGAVLSALRRRRWLMLLLAAGVVVLAIPFIGVLRYIAGSNSDLLSRIPPLHYLATQPKVILHYIRLTVFPYPLCLDYAWPLADSAMDVLLPGLVVVLLFVGTLLAAWRRQPVGFLGIWFFVTLAPASSIVPFEDLAFEHRMYLPLAAVVALLTCGAYRLLMKPVREEAAGKRAARVAAAAVAVAAVGALSVLTIMRNRVYSSEYGMWLDVAARRPNNVRAQLAVADALFERGDYAEAEKKAVDLLRRIESGDPGISDRRVRAASGDYYYPMLLNKLGQIMVARGRTEEAIGFYRNSIAARADDWSAYCNMAVAQYLADRKDAAMATCRTVIGLAPRYARGHAFLGFILAEKGQYAEAAGHYRKALEAAPGLVTARYDLAWLLATCPDAAARDGAVALSLAESVNEATGGQSYRTLDLLGTALAECGRFEDAEQAASKALELLRRRGAPAAGQEQPGYAVTADDIERRLDLYRQKKPFRDR